MIPAVISLLIAYVLGSIPTGFLLCWAVKKTDIRKHGSNSIGATNVFRVVGKKWGILVLVLDAFKAWLAVTMPFWLFPELPPLFSIALAAATLTGNTFPVWLKFKGGKGIATSLGVFIGLVPGPALITFALWGVVFGISRILSVASLAAAFIFPFAVYFFQPRNDAFQPFFIMSLFLPAFISWTHRANIKRLLKGEEKRLI